MFSTCCLIIPHRYCAAQDEKDRIVNDIRDWVMATGGNPSKDGCYTAFVNRVRDNLHLVLAMSPVGEAFRSRCRQFPSLINCTTIDWFSAWPEVWLQGHPDDGYCNYAGSILYSCI